MRAARDDKPGVLVLDDVALRLGLADANAEP